MYAEDDCWGPVFPSSDGGSGREAATGARKPARGPDDECCTTRKAVFKLAGTDYGQPCPVAPVQKEKLADKTQMEVRVTKDSGLFVKGRIQDVGVEWLVDTGCTSTIVSVRKFYEIPEDQQPKVEPYRRVLTSADGSVIGVHGTSELMVGVGRR